MMVGMKIEGRSLLRRTFVIGSDSEYETKKIDKAALYLPVERG